MPLKVMSSLAIKAVYLEVQPIFEHNAKVKVETQWVGMVDIKKRMIAGEIVDAVIGSSGLIDDLMHNGTLDTRTKVDLAKSGVGMAVRKGAKKPDIRTVDALKAALRAAKSIVYSSGPSGVYVAELFKRLGMDQELKPKARQAPPGVLVGQLVAKGQFELCFQQIPELKQVGAGVEIVGPLPAEVQLVTTFCGGVHAKAPDGKTAQKWLKYLASRDAEPSIRKHGLDPA